MPNGYAKQSSPVVDVTPNFRFEINGFDFLLTIAGLAVFLTFDSVLIVIRGRLFNLFKLFCVVVSRSLSFSFADLLPSLLSSFVRRPLSGDVRGFEPGSCRLDGRLRLSRDVGRGTIVDDFSTGFSSLSSACSSAASFVSAGAAVVGPLRPLPRRLNWGRGLRSRDGVAASTSAGFSVVA